ARREAQNGLVIQVGLQLFEGERVIEDFNVAGAGNVLEREGRRDGGRAVGGEQAGCEARARQRGPAEVRTAVGRGRMELFVHGRFLSGAAPYLMIIGWTLWMTTFGARTYSKVFSLGWFGVTCWSPAIFRGPGSIPRTLEITAECRASVEKMPPAVG